MTPLPMAPAVDEARVLWSVPEQGRAAELATRSLLVLLHGYGSHAADLFGLVPQLPASFVVASVGGLEPAGPGWAWFPLEVDPVTGNLTRDMVRVAAAAESLLAWVDDQRRAHPSIPGVHVLGFSQGGAMSLELLRRRPQDFASASVLSGFALPAQSQALRDADASLARVRPPVFWGRDPHDPVISADMVAVTRDWLPKHTSAEVHEYRGVGHGISHDEMSDLASFLTAVVRGPGPAQGS